MSKSIDIRDSDSDEITEIVVSDNLSVCNTLTGERSIIIEDIVGDELVAVKLDEIDNLIKALHKAKELWSK